MLGTQLKVYMFCKVYRRNSHPYPAFDMAFKNRKCVLACLTVFGRVDQSLFPRKDLVSIPYVVVCTLELMF